MNKTDFCVSCERVHWIITENNKKTLLITDSDIQNYITLVKMISGAKHVISLMIKDFYTQSHDLKDYDTLKDFNTHIYLHSHSLL